MGNVEEALIRVNRGFKAPTPARTASNGTTRRAAASWLSKHHGEYHQCIHVLKHTLLLLITETFDGINHEALGYLRTLAAKAGKAGCPDRTKYDSRARKLGFFVLRSSITRGGCRRRLSSAMRMSSTRSRSSCDNV